MASIGKVATIAVACVIAFIGLVGAKWYHTAAIEEIGPQQGVYGMAGLEVWIDINARMPSALRIWGCDTLRAREREALGGQNSLPPYSCQPNFGEVDDRTAYQTTVDANLNQALTGLDETRATALRVCFDAKMAAAVTPEEIQAMNDFDQAVMSKVVIAVSQTVRACKADVAG